MSAAVSRRDLEKRFNFHYLPHLEFDDYRVEQWIRKKCTWAYKRGYVDKLTLWLGKLHNKQLEQDYVPDVTIRHVSDLVGYGVFNNKPLEKWEYVGEYAGVLRRRNLFVRNINDYCFMYPRQWIALKAFTIDSEQQGNVTRFINHSDTPNLESIAVFYDGVFRIIFRAIEAIPANTELSYDYGDIYWRHRLKAI